MPNVVALTPFSTAATGGQPGLTAEEFNGQEVAGTPATTRVDRSVNVGMPLDIGVLASGEPLDLALFGGPPRPIATRWTGWYTPGSAGGRHDIVVQQGGFSDEGYRLYVDDKLVADRWSRNQAIMEATSVDLDARPHKVVLEFHSMVGFGSPFLRMGVMPENNWADPDALKLAKNADAVVLAVGFDAQSESEGWDRTFGLPPGQDALVERVAAVNKNVVVVVTSGGGVDMTRWVDKVPTVLEAWYPGQEGGTALAELLFGDVNPSGHLPVTFERKLADDPSFAHYYPASGSNRIDYAEGVFGGYRGFEKHGTAPLFPFGHGMSYTTFSYGKMTVTPVAGTSGSGARWQVSFDVTNTGTRSGAAVPQLYVGDAHASVPRPPKELKGFAKIVLRPGETRRVTIPLDTRSLAYYDVDKHEWRVEAGDFDLFLGRSSADIVQRAKLTVGKTTTIKVIASRDTQ
jgi:beta-glucosidase